MKRPETVVRLPIDVGMMRPLEDVSRRRGPGIIPRRRREPVPEPGVVPGRPEKPLQPATPIRRPKTEPQRPLPQRERPAAEVILLQRGVRMGEVVPLDKPGSPPKPDPNPKPVPEPLNPAA